MSNNEQPQPEDRTLSRMPSADDAGQTLSRPGGADDGTTVERTLSRPGANLDSGQTLSRPGADHTLSRPAHPAAPPPPASPAARKRGPVQNDKPIWDVGDLIDGKYDVTGVIGRGGMGVVYKVRHREWNIEIAVKTPLPDLVNDASAKARFFREAQTWVDLGLHPNIVQCWYVRELGGLPRVFADFVPGGSLKNWITDGRIAPGDWKHIIDLVVQACDGLDYAHQRGVVHRDVKPANMLMTSDGRLCVTDFGLVKLAGIDDIESATPHEPVESTQESTMLTMTGSVMGTPEYGAPEQWGGARHVDARADVYALGIMLFEMLCNRRPFDDGVHRESAQALIGRHLSMAAPDPRTFRPDLPEGLARITMACLAKKPDDRPQTMRGIRESLAAIYTEIFAEPFTREIPKATEARAAALNNRGVSLWDLNQPTDALAAWQEALKLDPQHAEALYNKSILEWRAAKITDMDVEQRIESTGANTKGKRNKLYLGFLHLECMAALEADAALTEAVGDPLISQDGTAWRALGHAKMAQEKFEEADMAYAQAFKRMPADDVTRECLKLAQRRTRIASDSNPEARAVTNGPMLFPNRHCVKLFDQQIGSLRALGVTPDGTFVLGAKGDYSVGLWELPWGNFVRAYRHNKEIEAIAVTVDGRHFITGGGDSALRMWSMQNDLVIESFYGKGHVGAIRALAVSRDGLYVVSAGRDKSIRLWGLPKGNLIRTMWGHDDAVQALAFTRDSRFILSGSDDQSLRLWDIETGTCTGALQGDVNRKWRAIEMSPDGRFALTAGTDKGLLLWDLRDGQILRQFRGHRGDVLAVAIRGDGRYCASGGDDHTVRLWDMQSGRCLRTFTGHSGDVQAVAFSADGKTLFSGALGNTNHPLRRWELAIDDRRAGVEEQAGTLLIAPLVVCRVESHAHSHAASKQFETLMATAQSAWQSGDASSAYTALKEARGIAGYERDPNAMALTMQLSSRLTKLSLNGGSLRKALAGHPKGVKAICLTGALASKEPAKFLASAGVDDNAIRLWTLASGRCDWTFEGHTRAVCSLAQSPDGKKLISGGADDTVRVWENAEFGKCLHVLEGHQDAINALAVAPDGRLAVSGSYDKTAALWDLNSGKQLKVFLGHTGPVNAVAITPDGRMALTGSRDKTLRLWSFSSGTCLKVFTGHLGEISTLAVTPKGRHVIAGGEDKTLNIWNLETGQMEKCLKGMSGALATMQVTPDGRFIITGGNEAPETNVRLWEIATGECVRSFGAHPKGISALSLSSDATVLVTGGADSPLRVWDLEWELDPGRKMEKSKTAAAVRSPNFFGFSLPTIVTPNAVPRTTASAVPKPPPAPPPPPSSGPAPTPPATQAPPPSPPPKKPGLTRRFEP